MVADGELRAVRAGAWECDGALTVADRQVAQRQGAVEMPAEIRFHRPIPLLTGPRRNSGRDPDDAAVS